MAAPEKHSHTITDSFSKIAQVTSQKLGHPASFVAACLIVIVWGVFGPIFKYSDTWQLVINTGTTIVTFLMVFLIQNTQNRDMTALHLKLDELIRVNQDARDKLLNLEDMTEAELKRLKENFTALGSRTDKSEILSEAKESLDEATEEIGEAREKIETVASKN